MKTSVHMMSTLRLLFCQRSVLTLLAAMFVVTGPVAGKAIVGQSNERQTPVQREIEAQRQRLNSTEVEERRDALMRLGSLGRPDASRVAAAGLSDVEPMVGVTAAPAIRCLPPGEAVTLLIPLFPD